MRAIADGTQSRRRGVGLVIHLRGILHQQHLLVAAGIRSRLLPMRLHQGFIPHMRILTEAIDRLGAALTVLLSRDHPPPLPSPPPPTPHPPPPPAHISPSTP